VKKKCAGLVAGPLKERANVSSRLEEFTIRRDTTVTHVTVLEIGRYMLWDRLKLRASGV
jgi:hypothetical protein